MSRYRPNGIGSRNVYIPKRRFTFDFVSDHLRFTFAENGVSFGCLNLGLPGLVLVSFGARVLFGSSFLYAFTMFAGVRFTR